MDRDALLLYLRNIRDLEVARYKLISDWKKVQEKYQQVKKNNQFAYVDSMDIMDEPVAEREAADMVGCLVVILGIISIPAILLVIVSLIGIIFAKEEIEICKTMLLVGLVPIVLTIVMFIVSVSYDNTYNDRLEAVKIHNNSEKNRVESMQNRLLAAANERYRNDALTFNQNLEPINELINDFYNMNIIPSQYRTLPAIHYIYEYMSTSQASLQDTLIHEHMENGIVRLEGKLNEIIYGIEDMVYQTRCINQKANEVIQQNNKMLSSLRSIESNSQLAAQYAELSANYNKANAYFSAANYLKR